MARSIVIGSPSYLLKKGLSATISELMEAQIVFIDTLDAINQHLDQNKIFAVIIDEKLLKYKEEIHFFFERKEETVYIALTNNEKCIPRGKNFDAQIHKDQPKEQIVASLEKALTLQTSNNSQKYSLLSERETDVLKLVALGYTNQEIADKLFISKHTVISHRKNITAKLGIKTVSGLTVYAVLNNLIPRDQIQ